jgi:molecular chaperone GrpE
MAKKTETNDTPAETARASATTADPTDIKIADLTDTLKRVQADYENYRKRVERDSKEWKRYAAKDLVIRLLPLLDSFELALSYMDRKDEHVKGMELVYSQLRSILEAEGVRPLECAGRRFDPAQHEAILAAEHDGEEGMVLEELQKGYLMHDQVIRPAKVKISKRKEAA